eukprot:snap_masked-scaffold_22-processed-gene-0.29-mRNA-1 protein AED:1.00 eAED:1.00 QI:0/-1/0/0/-1/1/1/0/73
MKLDDLCLEYWDLLATYTSQTNISKLEPTLMFPLENLEFKYPKTNPTSIENNIFIRKKLMSMEKEALNIGTGC